MTLTESQSYVLYAVIVIATYLFVGIDDHYKVKLTKTKYFNRLFSVLIFIVMFVLITYRNCGVDTPTYEYSFINNRSESNYDIVFFGLLRLVRYFTDNVIIWQGIMGGITLLGIWASSERLKEIIAEMIRHYANCFLEEKQMFEKALEMETNFESIVRYDTEIARLKEEQDKYYSLCSGLYEDLREGVVTKEEFERLHSGFTQKGKELEAAMQKQEQLIKDMFKKGALSAGRLKTFQDCVELREIDRHTLSSLVRRIDVYENRQVVIDFYFMDTFAVMAGTSRKVLTDRAAKTQTAERSA